MLRGIISVALVLCALGGVAYADNKEAAKQAYTEGKRQYDLGDYGAALEAFKRAYLNYEEPVFLFNIAQCYRAVGDRPSAVRTYRAFLRNWPKAPNREQVERIVSELEAAIAQDQTAKTTPPTDTMPPKNGAETASKTAVATAEPKPQTPPPHATAEPKPQTVETKPAATATKPEQAPPPATVPEPKPEVAHKPPPPKDDSGMVEIEPNFERPSGSSKGLRWWGWTLIAVSVAGVAAAAIALGVTQTGGSKFDSTLPDFNATALHTATLVRF
jgi:hypothetical protein